MVTPKIYYNDNDPSCCAWLKELMQDGLIPKGEIDQRSIAEVRPKDLRGYHQCHFFAGVGGWSLALRLAAWPEDREVWTGSCPCQPFSVAGKGKGFADKRHLWPAFSTLIRQCRPAVCIGKQVGSKLGRAWLAGVCADLEGMGYAFGASDLCAAGIGAPHIRQRLYWVAHAESNRVRGEEEGAGSAGQRRWRPPGDGAGGGLADRLQQGLEGHAGDGHERNESGRDGADAAGPATPSRAPDWNGPCVWWPCRDGVRRRIPKIESLLQYVAPGIPGGMDGRREARSGFPLTAEKIEGRVMLLRGAGNAISPPLAAEFVKAFMETEND